MRVTSEGFRKRPSLGSENEIRRCKPGLGTFVEISIAGELSDDELIDRSQVAFAEIQRLEALLSFHDQDSELSRLNREGHRGERAVSPDLGQILEFALSLSRATEGRFDLTVAPELVRRGVLPDTGAVPESRGSWRDIHCSSNRVAFDRPLHLDLGGIAKGYAVDRALAALGNDVEATVNAGGDLRSTSWEGKRVGLQVPAAKGERTILEWQMLRPAVATSASYYLDGEAVILFPETLEPVDERLSVSVFAPSAMVADALTKVVLLSESPDPLLERNDAVAVVVDASGEIVTRNA